MSSDILVSETSQHKTVDKIVLYLHTSTCVQRLEGSIVSSDALRAEVKPAIFGLYIVRNGALMSFAHQQVGECKISGFLGTTLIIIIKNYRKISCLSLMEISTTTDIYFNSAIS